LNNELAVFTGLGKNVMFRSLTWFQQAPLNIKMLGVLSFKKGLSEGILDLGEDAIQEFFNE